MTGGQGPLTPAISKAAGVARPLHWRVVALVVAAVSAIVLFVGGTAGPLLLAILGMLATLSHLLVARPWQRPGHHTHEEG